MSPEETALLNSIVLDPLDDTTRLVYADWLDENPHTEARKCTACVNGKQNDCQLGDLFYSEWDCESCQGHGYFQEEDVGRNAARAELIRLQVGLVRVGPKWCSVCRNTGLREINSEIRDRIRSGQEEVDPHCSCPTGRTQSILHKWQVPFLGGDRCPHCIGTEVRACGKCGSTRYVRTAALERGWTTTQRDSWATKGTNVFGERQYYGTRIKSSLNLEWSRGFLDRFSVVATGNMDGPYPQSSWVDLVLQHPVTRIGLTNKRPVELGNGRWYLFRQDRVTGPRGTTAVADLPVNLFLECERLYDNGEQWASLIFESERAAVACLERAACNLLRTHADLPRIEGYSDLL